MKTNRGISRAIKTGVAIVSLSIACVPHETTDPSEGTGDKSMWNFTFAAERTNLTIKQGAADTVPLTITRSGGFNGDVQLQGITMGGFTVSFTPEVRTGLVSKESVIFAIDGNTGPIVINAVVGANPQTEALQPKTIEFTLNIIRKDGVFVTAPSTLSVSRGGSTSATIGVIRTNYTDPVPMSLATNTAGLTATFSPNPLTGNSGTMTLSAASTVAEGTYNVGVRALEGTPLQGTAPVALTVTAPAPPGSITVSFSVGTLIVPRGQSVPIGMTINRNNYGGLVSVNISGLPSGVTFAATPTSANSMSINFTAASTAVPGTYPIVVTASGAGISDATANLSIQVGQ